MADMHYIAKSIGTPPSNEQVNIVNTFSNVHEYKS